MHPLPAFAFRLLRVTCGFAGACAATPLFAASISGVWLPPFLQTSAGVLELATCGVRDSLWVEHYAAALYVPRGASPLAVGEPDSAKALHIHILDARYLPDRIPEKWRRALQSELPQRTMSRLQQVYPTLSRGDVIDIVYLPGRGVSMGVNGHIIVKAPGHRVIDSILQAWAGRDSLSAKLERLTIEHPCVHSEFRPASY